MITARDFPTVESITNDPIAIAPAKLFEKFHDGEVTIGSVLSQRTGVKPGQMITLQTRQGPRALRVAASGVRPENMTCTDFADPANFSSRAFHGSRSTSL